MQGDQELGRKGLQGEWSSAAGERSLAEVIERLSGVLFPADPEADYSDIVVSDVQIVDASEEVSASPGAIALVVGMKSPALEAASVLRAADRDGAAAVVVKAPRTSGPALKVMARRHNVPCVMASETASWNHLFQLIRSAIDSLPQQTYSEDTSPNDLFSFANMVATYVGGPTTIEDSQSRVLAYSSHGSDVDEVRRATILGHCVPDDWMKRLGLGKIYRRLLTEAGVIRVDFDQEVGIRTRLAISIRVNDEVFGSIWVAETGDRVLNSESEATLERMARLAPHQLLRYRAVEELQWRHSEELLQRALDGDAGDNDSMSALGITPGVDGTVVCVEPRDGDPATRVVSADRIVRFLRLNAGTIQPAPTLTSRDGIVYMLIPGANRGEKHSRDICGELYRRLSTELSVDVRIGIGSTGSGLVHVAESRREGERILRVLANVEQRVADADDVWSSLVLMRVAELLCGEADILRGCVGRLLDYDRMRNTEYIATLQAYFRWDGEVREAASRMFVHPNTFRYRLGRLQELVALDLDDPSQRLAAHLQLYLLEQYEVVRPSPERGH